MNSGQKLLVSQDEHIIIQKMDFIFSLVVARNSIELLICGKWQMRNSMNAANPEQPPCIEQWHGNDYIDYTVGPVEHRIDQILWPKNYVCEKFAPIYLEM